MIPHMAEEYKSFQMVPHMVYIVILVTIQRQFINVQYRVDASKVANMVRYRVIYIYKYSQNRHYIPILSMLQSHFIFRTSQGSERSGHPRYHEALELPQKFLPPTNEAFHQQVLLVAI